MSDTSIDPPAAPRSDWEPPALETLQRELPLFHFVKMIGRGGMGAVYQATQLALGRPVAVKVLPAALMEDAEAYYAKRFRQEATLMAQFSHPHIVAVFESGQSPGGLLYMVMEFVEGTDLAQVIRSQGKLTQTAAVRIASQICLALECAHGHGILHRDIKPSNILLLPEGTAKVADFGLAKQFDSHLQGLTKTSVAVGTPDFLAPEAWIPGLRLDGRADLYSLGVVLYQMLTGEVPRGLWRMPGEIAGTLAQLDTIIDRSMQPDREARYATAAEFLADLEMARLALAAPRAMPRASRRVVAWTAAMAVLALLATGLFLWHRFAGQAQPWSPLPTVVFSTLPEGPGSLSQAITNADQNPGPDTILFDPALSGQTLLLPRIQALETKDRSGDKFDLIRIDATTLPGGISFSFDPESANLWDLFIALGREVEIKGVVFRGGRRDYGGCLFNQGKLTLLDCRFFDNSGNSGGAIMNEGDLILTRCSFRGNRSSASGGAVFSRGKLAMTDCTLMDNDGGTAGGALFLEGTSASLTRCTIQGNRAARQGGGILINTGTLTLTHCTITENQVEGTASSHGGGGLYFADAATLRLDGCIVAGNRAASNNGPDIWARVGQPSAVRCLIGDGKDAALQPGGAGNRIGVAGAVLDARLSPIGNYGGSLMTMPPLPGSAAIDAAVGSMATVDQRERAVSGIPDIGAAEAVP